MDIQTFIVNPSVWGICLAIAFGIILVAALKPMNLRRPTPWVALVVGAAIFAPCIAWIQVPLQTLVGNGIAGLMGILSYQDNILWAGIPVILLTGLVQEGAKMVPVVGYWFYKGRDIDPKIGLSVGLMAGAGFGVFEAQWVLNDVFASGWSWAVVGTYGFLGIAPFLERFFAIAFHIASGGLTGWGLAKGWGWQFYLVASFLHFLLNYAVLFGAKGIFNAVHIEIWVGVLSALVFGFVLWLRWRNSYYDQFDLDGYLRIEDFF